MHLLAAIRSFAGKGKLSAVKILKKDVTHAETLKMHVTCWDVSNDLFKCMEAFTCQIYSASSKTKTVNELRFNLFCARKGEAESLQLPPCSSSLKNHCKRANYQCRIWSLSLESFPDVPTPIEHGWILEDGDLTIDWSSDLPAPEAVMQLLSCVCSKKCEVETCTCLQNT